MNRVADRTVKIRIGVDISGMQSQLRAAQASVADFSKKSVSHIQKNSGSIDDLSRKVGVVGVGLLGLATVAVSSFAKFDKAMSGVAATGDDARGSIDALRQAAIDAGADTAFSASEAAGAIEQLAKAGVSAKDILGGGLSGALSLAAAGGLEVGDAAEIAATALTQFKLQGSDVGHVADLLAAGAGKAQGSVADMGSALKYAGVPLAQLGVSIEETAGSIALFAKNGILGEQAGTSLRSIISSLTSPSASAAAEMDRLKISVFDANDEFIGMEGVAGQMQSRLGTLTEKERAASLGRIFGNESLQAANVLYDQGSTGIAKWTKAVDDSGYAAETARTQTDNLIGDVERLGGSLDSVFIQSGTGANDSLRGIVQGAEAAVDAIGGLPAPVLNVTTLIAGAGGLALLGVAGLGKLTTGFAEAKTAATALGISTKAAGLAAGGLGAALAIGTIAFATWAQNAAEAKARTDEFQGTLDAFGKTTDATLSSINDRLSGMNQNDWIENLLGKDPESLIDRAQRIGLAIEDLQGYILGNADATEKVTQATQDYIAAQGDELTTADIRAQAGRFLTDQLDAEAGSLTDAQKAAAQKKLADDAAGVATGELGSASQGAAAKVDTLTKAVEDNWKATMDASGAVLGLRDAQRQAEAAYDDARKALKDNGKTLDVSTEKGRANQAALDGIASSGLAVVDSLRAQGAPLKDVQGAMSVTREQYIKTAVSMGMSEKAAKRLADQLGLQPKNVKTTVTVDTGNALAQIATLNNTLNSINGKTVHASVVVKRYGQAAMASGGRLAGFPTGGRLPGSPPADPMQDNLVGVDGAGMPRVLVRSREWVVNQTASDYYGDGIMSAINSQAIPRDALAGLSRLATGGAVGAAERQVSALRDALAAARHRKDSDAKIERLQSRLDDAAARRDRLRSEAADLRTQLRRGEIRQSVTGGLSGAYSSLDDLRSLADSGDLGKDRTRRLRNTAGKGENALKSLYTQADRVEKKLADARTRLEELQGVREGVRSNVVGGFSLSDVRGDFDPKTGKRVASASQLAAAAKAYAGKAKKFAGLLGQLQKKTGSAAIVQEVAGYGVEAGSAMAQSLLADLPALRSLGLSYAAISKYGGLAGSAVARSVGGGNSVAEAAAAVKTAEAQARSIDKRIGKWGKVIGQEMAKALGVKARATGGSYNAGDLVLTGERGPELEFKTRPGYVLTADATRRLAYASGSSSVSGGGSPTYNDNSLSVTTNRDVTPATLLRFDRHRSLLRGRNG